MTYAAKSILWIIGGPIASVVLGYAVFMFFVFAVGPGMDIDDVGTPIAEFFGRLALPALGIIALGGFLLSMGVGIRYAIAHRARIAESYPNLIPQPISRRTKEGEQGAPSNR